MIPKNLKEPTSTSRATNGRHECSWGHSYAPKGKKNWHQRRTDAGRAKKMRLGAQNLCENLAPDVALFGSRINWEVDWTTVGAGFFFFFPINYFWDLVLGTLGDALISPTTVHVHVFEFLCDLLHLSQAITSSSPPILRGHI